MFRNTMRLVYLVLRSTLLRSALADLRDLLVTSTGASSFTGCSVKSTKDGAWSFLASKPETPDAHVGAALEITAPLMDTANLS